MSDDNNGANNASVVAGAAGGIAGLLSSPLRSKLFLVAFLATLAGSGTVVWGQLSKDAPIPEWAPIAMRVGASFVAAFVFAYLVRRAVMLAMLVGGGLIAGALLLNKLGVGISQEQIDELKQHVEHGAEVIQQTGDSAWAQIKAYLPSGGAAGFGFYRGVRHAKGKTVKKDD